MPIYHRVKSLGVYITVVVVGVLTVIFLRRYPTLSATTRTMSQVTIKLNDGREIPWLGFGTGTALYGKDAEKSVGNAISKGFVHLDGAQMYQNEDSLGKAIATAGVPREKLFVTTKLYKLAEGETVRENLLQSLKKLQVDYVDLFLVHVPQDFGSGLKEIWRQFEDLKTEGLTKSIGVSNCRIRDFAALGLDEPGGVRILPAINQVRSVCEIVRGDLRTLTGCIDVPSSLYCRSNTIHTSTLSRLRCWIITGNTTLLRRRTAACLRSSARREVPSTLS